MATGITKNKWTEDTLIISREGYTGDFLYEISYLNKSSEKSVLECLPQSEYISVFNKNMTECHAGSKYQVATECRVGGKPFNLRLTINMFD